MLHAKFQDHRTSSSGEEYYNNGLIYVYSPGAGAGAGAENPLETLFVKNMNFLSNWTFTASFSQLMTL